MSELLAPLNESQRQAVTYGDGPLMILAGAGTGKTTVIASRFAWLVREKRAASSAILALTFTEKATRELEERIDRLLPLGHLNLHIHTFHSFCEWVLRRHGVEIGLAPDFEVLSEVDAWLFARRHLNELPLQCFRPAGKETKFLRHIIDHLSRVRDEGVTPDVYAAFADKEGIEAKELAAVFAAYEALLLKHHALDFAGLMAIVHLLLVRRPRVLDLLRQEFPYILVDEFQDTNPVQYELVKLLATPKNNLTIVGDDDQSIYRFRGASVENILAFTSDYPNAAKVVLTENHRSKQEILDVAYRLIQGNNPNRLEVQTGLSKKLLAAKGSGGVVIHWEACDGAQEVQAVVEEIERLKNEPDFHWSDVGILVRANDHATSFVHALERAGIPYRFVAMRGLYQKPAILDMLAWLRVIHLPFSDRDLARILHAPHAGLSPVDASRLIFESERRGKKLFDIIEGSVEGLSKEGETTCQFIRRTQEELALLARTKPVSEVFIHAAYKSGMVAHVEKMPEGGKRQHFRYLGQFLERLRRFENQTEDPTLPAFLAEFEEELSAGEAGSIEADVEEGPDVVSVMTVHAAKGLEFRFVFVCNLVEARFPIRERAEGIPVPEGLLSSLSKRDSAHEEEERRLFYVASTRAKDRLYLTSALDYGGVRQKKPSKFLAEMGVSTQIVQSRTGSLLFPEPTGHVDLEQPVVDLPKYASFTQIADFERCPLQYKFRHVLRIPVVGNMHISYGTSIHAALELFTKQWIQREEPPPLTDLIRLYEMSWIDEWYKDDAVRAQFFEKGKLALAELYQTWEKIPPRPLAAEEKFTCAFEGGILRGQIDRVDLFGDGLAITDYKTGTPKTSKTLKREDRAQLYLYQWAVEELWKRPVKRLTYFYLEDNSSVDFLGTAEDVARVKRELEETWTTIRSSTLPPKPNPVFCSMCSFANICEFRAT